MQVKKYLGLALFTSVGFSSVVLSDVVNTALENGKVSGNIRAYYNTRDYETRADESAFALGGALRAETGGIGAFKFGLGAYTAQDLGNNIY
jgi:hypothetical protein